MFRQEISLSKFWLILSWFGFKILLNEAIECNLGAGIWIKTPNHPLATLYLYGRLFHNQTPTHPKNL